MEGLEGCVAEGVGGAGGAGGAEGLEGLEAGGAGEVASRKCPDFGSTPPLANTFPPPPNKGSKRTMEPGATTDLRRVRLP